ncbi:MAG: GspE/PulE family protein [Firmicutes bacterium]|nr:GspE/PulE family protein [Bacillota bacterium]
MNFFDRFKKEKSHPFLDLLTNDGFISKKEVKEIQWLMENTQLEIEDALFRFLPKERILLAKSMYYENSFETLDLLDILSRVENDVLNLLPRDKILEKRVIVTGKNQHGLIVAMDDPYNEDVSAYVEETTGLPIVKRYIMLMEDLRKALKELDAIEERKREEEAEKAARKQARGDDDDDDDDADDESYGTPVKTPDTAVIQEFTIGGADFGGGMRPLVDAIFKQGLTRGASDIHIEPTRKDMQIRYRIDGVLTADPKIDAIIDKTGRNRKLHETIVNIIKNRSGEAGKTMRLDETEKPQDGRIYIPEVDLDLRVSVVPTILGESVVIRIHYREIGEFTLDRLGFESKTLARFHKLLEAPYGIFFVAGPTGSGKTTTLYSILQIINTPGKKTMTVEDPVEYSIPGANQSQINLNKDYTFDMALRSFLRHDPDIIMVGEIRDIQTANMAMEAALTGHLVLSSIHANNAVSTVTRLKDLGVDPRLITATCVAAIGQRLVRRVCPDCQKPFMFSTRLYNAFENYEIKYNPRKLVKGSGCNSCNMTGYKGRIGIFELLTMGYDVREAILKDATEEELFDLARKQGMLSLIEDALSKVACGITTEEEVWRVTLLEGSYEQ